MRVVIKKAFTEALVMTAFLLYGVMTMFYVSEQPHTWSYGEWGNLFMLAFFVRCVWIREKHVIGTFFTGLLAYLIVAVIAVLTKGELTYEPNILMIAAVGFAGAYLKVEFGFTQKVPSDKVFWESTFKFFKSRKDDK